MCMETGGFSFQEPSSPASVIVESRNKDMMSLIMMFYNCWCGFLKVSKQFFAPKWWCGGGVHGISIKFRFPLSTSIWLLFPSFPTWPQTALIACLKISSTLWQQVPYRCLAIPSPWMPSISWFPNINHPLNRMRTFLPPKLVRNISFSFSIPPATPEGSF